MTPAKLNFYLYGEGIVKFFILIKKTIILYIILSHNYNTFQTACLLVYLLHAAESFLKS
jgi:hypothetical protein